MAGFDADVKMRIDELLSGHAAVRPGKRFEYPAYYLGKKLCLCIMEKGISIKLPVERVAGRLQSDPNASVFQAYGRMTMREWVQITPDDLDEYRKYLPLIEESIRFLQASMEQSGS